MTRREADGVALRRRRYLLLLLLLLLLRRRRPGSGGRGRRRLLRLKTAQPPNDFIVCGAVLGVEEESVA
jgi:hypothetical protein